MEVTIHNNKYTVKDDEFIEIDTPNLYPLRVRESVSNMDREIAIIDKLKSITPILYYWWGDHGGYVLKNLTSLFNQLSIIRTFDDLQGKPPGILRIPSGVHFKLDNLSGMKFIIADSLVIESSFAYTKYALTECRYLYVHNSVLSDFIVLKLNNGDKIVYNNLIRILFMIKNAGDIFYDVLTKNILHSDKISILDTGSTDNTLEIIEKVKQEYPDFDIDLYQEPFINFRASRNRLFDLADKEDEGNAGFAFNIVLDDTYILDGDVRSFLEEVRGDDVAESFSLYIKEVDIIYSSNRVTKPRLGLRYMYRIHEIIENNYNVLIPKERAWINSLSSDYMKKRTTDRKQQDLVWLFEELEENPDDPRSLYYIAETYLCMKDWNNAYEYYTIRGQFHNDGYNEEKYDALYKRAVMADLYLDIEWEKCQQMYLDAYECDPLRPESIFMIGKHYADLGINQTAYFFIKRAFEIFAPPESYNMNIKLDMYKCHIPKYLMKLCHTYKNYHLGEKAARVLTEYLPDDEEGKYWLSVFFLLNQNEPYRNTTKKITQNNRKSVLFVCPGGWEQWDGETLRTRGLGGSETCVIRFAEEISKTCNMYVVCNCPKERVYNNVHYIPIVDHFLQFISECKIDVCFVHRYPEYLPLIYKNGIKTYLILHDLVRDNEIIPTDDLFEGILTLTQWHKEHVQQAFPRFTDKVYTISYGIDIEKYDCNIEEKEEMTFIYPSFANRGLYWLLKMFPKITERYPNAILNVFCRFDLDYVHKNCEYEIEEVQRMISEQTNVINNGWVNEKTLIGFWKKSKYWFYTSHFQETCCRIGMEAAASRTLAITNDLAALKYTVEKDRGIVIPGYPGDGGTWNEMSLQRVFNVLDGSEDTNELIEKNYQWISSKTYPKVVEDFMRMYVNDMDDVE